jgi:integrin beta-like protein
MCYRKISEIFTLATALCMLMVFAPPAGAAATITVVNLDGAGEGFNDAGAADADSTAGGNTGTTLGAQRLQAFQFAANIWGGLLDSSVVIRVGAVMDPLTCDATSATLGRAGPNQGFQGFTGALRAKTVYPSALANKLAATDLDSTTDDISATFNSSIGTTCALPTVWYYGLNGAPPGNKIDFVAVVLHELGHGLGFLTFVDLATGAKPGGGAYDDAFMLYLEDHSTGKLYPDMTDAERVAASTNNGNLHWVGLNTVSDGIILTSGRLQPSGHVQMNAPATQKIGSSVSHFDPGLTPDQLMEPSYTGPNHSAGLALSVLEDIGWVTGKKTDVYFVTDLSGSFFDDLPVFKTEAPKIINDLKNGGVDLKVGLGSFEDYPISPFGSATSGDVAYRRNIDLTSDTAAVLAVISALQTKDGADLPESQLAALYQAATGAGQDLSAAGFAGASIPAGLQAHFRSGAVKLFLLWTDAAFHRPGDAGSIPYPGPSFDQTIAAIKALDPPKVIGVASGSDPGTIADIKTLAAATGGLAPAGGVDCDGNGTIDIPEGQPLVCSTAITGAGVGAAMLATIEAAVKPTEVAIDLRSPVNVRSGGVAVAVLSTATFDARAIDASKVCFGGQAILGVGDCTESHGRLHLQDVNFDGLIDVVLHFDTRETGLTPANEQACLIGKTREGASFEGCQAVKVLP